MSGVWIDVAPVEELLPGLAQVVQVEGSPVVVMNLDGEYRAVSNICTHEDWPILSDGFSLQDVLEQGDLVCPHHGAHFCPHTGDALTAPAYDPLAVYLVRVENGRVQVAAEAADPA